MARPFSPHIVTANDLMLGDVIYLTKQGTWTRAFEEAHVARSAEQLETMLAVAGKQAGNIVGAYGVAVELNEDGKISPAHFREAFRKRGPSNYFHGKQAEA